MNVSVGERWERFVEETLHTGRYGSASEIVREGLRLVEEREARLRALRDAPRTWLEAEDQLTEEPAGAAPGVLATLKIKGPV